MAGNAHGGRLTPAEPNNELMASVIPPAPRILVFVRTAFGLLHFAADGRTGVRIGSRCKNRCCSKPPEGECQESGHNPRCGCSFFVLDGERASHDISCVNGGTHAFWRAYTAGRGKATVCCGTVTLLQIEPSKCCHVKTKHFLVRWRSVQNDSFFFLD